MLSDPCDAAASDGCTVSSERTRGVAGELPHPCAPVLRGEMQVQLPSWARTEAASLPAACLCVHKSHSSYCSTSPHSRPLRAGATTGFRPRLACGPRAQPAAACTASRWRPAAHAAVSQKAQGLLRVAGTGLWRAGAKSVCSTGPSVAQRRQSPLHPLFSSTRTRRRFHHRLQI